MHGKDQHPMRQRDLFENSGQIDRSAGACEQLELFADVALNVATDHLFTYAVPAHLRNSVVPGIRVLVPFGRRRHPLPGYVVELRNEAPAHKCKPIARILDHDPLLDPSMLDLARQIARYYCCSLGQVLEAMLPAGVRAGTGLRPVRFYSTAGVATEPCEGDRLSAKQRRLLQLLSESDGPIPEGELLRRAGCGRSPLKKLVDRGLVRMHVEYHLPRAVQRPFGSPPDQTTAVDLTGEQKLALSEIRRGLRSNEHRIYLLHGVTGSGKTEVYIRAIQDVLKEGKQAILLVPEISLTPQTQERFEARLGPVAVLHSHLSPLERHIQWRRIRAGEVGVVIGARSAVFAPCPNLGLIVIDEEHETSFKQDTTPRYHARTVAIMRARKLGIPVVLGSATPSLESWARAVSGKYRLLRLPHRIHRKPLPSVRIIDMRYEKINRRESLALSLPLKNAIRATLDSGGQVILFLNRRGFATIVQCRRCGHVATCEYCDTSLVYHRHMDTLLCHTCDNVVPPFPHCPECESEAINYRGTGTERLEAEIQRLFPNARVARMDADTMRRRGAHRDVLDRFRRHEIDILLGTQMIAKGLDFPNVMLVGVVNADVALHLPDFRAAERTFQLVAQVAGRTGRGDDPGSVIVQTYRPDHIAIQAASQHDYERFAQHELELRRRHGYPPFGRLARVLFRGVHENLVKQTAEAVADQLRRAVAHREGFRVLGPAPAPLFRMRGELRYHLQLIGPPTESLGEFIKPALERVDIPTNVAVSVDVDPLNLL